MVSRSVLIAGDSNLKQLLDHGLEPSIDVLCVPGARLVDDATGFVNRLLITLSEKQRQHLYLHLGSNDVHKKKIGVIERYYDMLLDQISKIAPACTVTICEVLPRGWNFYKQKFWNRDCLPVLKERVKGINSLLGNFCSRRDIKFLSYSDVFSSKVHLARDGLHVNRDGAVVIQQVLLSGVAEMELPKLEVPVDVPSSKDSVKDENITPRRTYAEVAAMPVVKTTNVPVGKVADTTVCSKKGQEELGVKGVTRRGLSRRRLRKCRRNKSKTQPCTRDIKTCRPARNDAREQKTASIGKMVRCPICPKTFSGDLFLLDHFIKRHKEGLSSACDDVTSTCNRRLPKKNAVESHKTSLNFPSLKTKPYSQRYKQNSETDVAAVILDYTYQEWSEIYSIMMLGWMCGFEGMCFILENLNIRHCSNTIRCRLLLAGDVEQNPGPADTFQCLWESCRDPDHYSIRSLAQHVIQHVSEKRNWCCWDGCVFHSHDDRYLESHALQHIYQDYRWTECLSTLETWSLQLPYGEFNPQSTDLHLCPAHLRAKFEVLLLDEHFQLPKTIYSLLDHEIYLWKMKEQKPEDFFTSVEDFVQRRSAKGDIWKFNKEKWIKDGHSIYKTVHEEPSEDGKKMWDFAPKLDVYHVKNNVNNINDPILTSRPELVGQFQNTVRFKFHYDNGVHQKPPQQKRKFFSENVSLSEKEPWIDNVICNLTRCQEAIELERKVLRSLTDKKFLSSSNKCLVNCEEKALSLATYPSCTEGVFFFSVIDADLEQSDATPQYPKFYIRFIESGCYTDFMTQVVLPILAHALNTDVSCFLVTQVSTVYDIQKEQDKVKVKLESAKRNRPDKIFKSSSSKLKSHLQQTLSSAQESNIDLNYFLHFVRKGYKVSIDNLRSDDWYITSNFAENIQQDIVTQMKDYPLTRLEGVTKSAHHFSEETVPQDASLYSQSKFLNYLSNDHHVSLKGKPLCFLDRFPISTSPASFRNKVVQYFTGRRYRDIVQLFRDAVPVLSSSSSYVELGEVPVTPRSKRQRKNAHNVRSKRVTKEMVEESINIRTDISFGNSADPLSLYENYKRQLLQFGTLHIQVSNTSEVIAIMNDYDDEEGNFKRYDYVYTGRIQTETGYTFTCSCKIYRTLLECVGNTDNIPFDTLDTSNGVKCIHCRFFNCEIVLNLELSESSTVTQIRLKVQNALSSLEQPVIQLEGKLNTRKFSVLTNDIPSFVHLTWNRSTGKYIISCMDGFCRSQKGAKKNVDNFMTGDLCEHLMKLQDKPELWKGFTTVNEEHACVADDDQEEILVAEASDGEVECAPDIEGNTDNDANFDDVTGLWSFKCLSAHSARLESSSELTKNVRERDSWNDQNPNCVPRQDGCLKGPDLMEPIPEFSCLCSAGWRNDEYPDGKLCFDRNIIIYTDNAPVQCKVFTRLCLKSTNHEEPCKLKWDEGASMCVHVVTRDSAAGDEIGWEFVNQVLTSRTTFSSFCNVKNKLYKLRDPNSRNFMHKDVFIKWWFSWAANRKIDFRQPCPVCQYSPKQLACDGTKVGIGFRHASFQPINEPTEPNIIHPTLHRRMDRCFLPNSDRSSKETLSSCRAHMHYLAASYLKELKIDDVLPADEVATMNTRLQEVLPLEILPSFNRLLASMDTYEKDAYAGLFKILSTTAPLGSLLPAHFIENLSDLVDHLTGVRIQPNGDVFFNNTMQSMRYYAPEIRNLIANSMHCNTDDDGNSKLHQDISMLLRYIIDCVLSLSLNDFQQAEIQVGTYNPLKYGRAYYFSPSGCKLRNIRKFSIDVERDKSHTYDDAPMDFELCRKYFSKTHIAARGSTSLFLWFCPNHGHCYGFHMALAEGRKDPFASLYSHLQDPPKDIFYDFACNLQEYCLNRESAYYYKVRFFHDIFHGYAHKCSVAYKSSRLFGFESINSEICEQFNSFLQCIKASAVQMNQKHFCFYLQFFLHIWNEKKYSKFQRRLNVALAGF